jgi:DNA polymerase-3 subunit delta
MAEEMRALYLIAGSDEAKIDATRARLRARAERDGGPAALEVFEPSEGRGAPDHEALLGSIPAMSLTESRRYLLADGIERWREGQLAAVAEAIAELPPDLTVVLIARGKPPAKLSRAVKLAGGDVHDFQAATPREMPRALVAEAGRLGFGLDQAAARLLVDRMGANPRRLQHELERLATWAGAGADGTVTAADLEAMIADTSEAAVWALSDALLERNAATALRLGERLIAQGENVTGLIYGLASRLRKACAAATQLEAGVPSSQVESGLGMHPYAAKQLVGRLRHTSGEDLREATGALADLEVWCRGGADYGDELALTLALRKAAGVAV